MRFGFYNAKNTTLHYIDIPCHPMSRKVLLAQYGAGVITLRSHDPLFDLISGAHPRHSAGVRNEHLSCTVRVAVSRPLAKLITLSAHEIGWRLLRLHKQQLCWYAVSQVRMKGKGAALPAIRDWLSLHDVEEDEYQLETAYKLWLRFGWDFDRKNAFFSARLRSKSSGRKTGERAKNETFKPLELRRGITFDDVVLGLRASSLLDEYKTMFKTVPQSLHKHITVYLVIHRQHLSQRDAAAKLDMTRYNVRVALDSIERRAGKNRAFATMLASALALP